MTYKEIVDNIQAIVDAHKILADFGYGQVSDIKTGGDDQEANYPYAFLNPQTHTRSERAINYRFNLIVMDMYLGDDFLSAQSQCQQYIDDILAEMKYGTQTYDIAINATLTPFKERFQDVVGGMTATIDIEVPQKLNLCVAPYVAAPLPPTGCPTTLPIFSENLLTIDYSGDPDNAGGLWRFDDALVSNTDIATWADLYTLNAIAGSYEFTVIQTLVFAEPVAGETLPPKPQLRSLSFPGHPDAESNCDSGNWPTVWTPDPITYTAQFRVTTTAPTGFTIVGFPSNPAEESGFTQIAGGILNIGFEGVIPEQPTIIYQIEQSDQISPFNRIGSEGGPSLDVNATIIDTQYLTEAGSELDTELLQDGTYRFTYTTTSANLIDQSVIDAAKANDPAVWTDPDGKMYLQSGWFFGETLVLWNTLDIAFTESIAKPYTLTHTFDISLPAGRYKFNFTGQPYSNDLEYVANWSNVQYQIELLNLDPYTV